MPEQIKLISFGLRYRSLHLNAAGSQSTSQLPQQHLQAVLISAEERHRKSA